MNSISGAQDGTVLDRLIEYVRAKDLALDGQQRPVAVLWTDPKGEWRPVIELMQTHVEELLVLGEYDPGLRSGPAVWLRCIVDRALDSPTLPEDRAPILYLPHVARQDLRAGDQCPEELKPLVELMFRGTLWLQHNGSDWGVSSFLTSTKTLGLDISGDHRTAEAMLRAISEVVVSPIAQLSGKRLEADDFDRMLSGDLTRDVLRWMADPGGTQARLGESGWGAFCSRCKDEMDFDPATGADVTAGEQLGRRTGPWKDVWARFEEAPASFPGVEALLRRSRPSGELPFDREAWPDLNDEDEETVRKGLRDLCDRPHGDACAIVLKLEEQHSERRSWVWSRIGLSPMAQVLAPLSRLANAARTVVGGSTPDEVAGTYRERGWQGDAAAWEAIAVAPSSDEQIVSDAVSHLLRPWLEDSAMAFQKAATASPLPASSKQLPVETPENGCLIFCDGLRYDLGQRLAERLEGLGCRVTLRERWAATPTVTATAKPAITPVADAIGGQALGKDFTPQVMEDDRPANAANLRKVIEKRGSQILGAGELEIPLEHPARGWLECGSIDSLGHKLQSRMARQIDEELDRLVERILGLISAGWESVRVVTDHGWLLMPGGLPKVDLPKHLTESRWARCAVVSGESDPGMPRYPWYWNANQYFATAPGIACFNKSDEYAHGGLSVQECLIPDLQVERSGEATAHATIRSITWRGLRCFVEAATTGPDVTADLRVRGPAGESAVAAAKPVEDGTASLVLAGDEYEEAQLVLVLTDVEGHILAHRSTRVGEES